MQSRPSKKCCVGAICKKNSCNVTASSSANSSKQVSIAKSPQTPHSGVGIKRHDCTQHSLKNDGDRSCSTPATSRQRIRSIEEFRPRTTDIKPGKPITSKVPLHKPVTATSSRKITNSPKLLVTKESPSATSSKSNAQHKSSSPLLRTKPTTPSKPTADDYLQFLLCITEDILLNNLYEDEDVERVFQAHINANRHRLDVAEMSRYITKFKKDIGFPRGRPQSDRIPSNICLCNHTTDSIAATGSAASAKSSCITAIKRICMPSASPPTMQPVRSVKIMKTGVASTPAVGKKKIFNAANQRASFATLGIRDDSKEENLITNENVPNFPSYVMGLSEEQITQNSSKDRKAPGIRNVGASHASGQKNISMIDQENFMKPKISTNLNKASSPINNAKSLPTQRNDSPSGRSNDYNTAKIDIEKFMPRSKSSGSYKDVPKTDDKVLTTLFVKQNANMRPGSANSHDGDEFIQTSPVLDIITKQQNTKKKDIIDIDAYMPKSKSANSQKAETNRVTVDAIKETTAKRPGSASSTKSKLSDQNKTTNVVKKATGALSGNISKPKKSLSNTNETTKVEGIKYAYSERPGSALSHKYDINSIKPTSSKNIQLEVIKPPLEKADTYGEEINVSTKAHITNAERRENQPRASSSTSRKGESNVSGKRSISNMKKDGMATRPSSSTSDRYDLIAPKYKYEKSDGIIKPASAASRERQVSGRNTPVLNSVKVTVSKRTLQEKESKKSSGSSVNAKDMVVSIKNIIKGSSSKTKNLEELNMTPPEDKSFRSDKSDDIVFENPDDMHMAASILAIEPQENNSKDIIQKDAPNRLAMEQRRCKTACHFQTACSDAFERGSKSLTKIDNHSTDPNAHILYPPQQKFNLTTGVMKNEKFCPAGTSKTQDNQNSAEIKNVPTTARCSNMSCVMAEKAHANKPQMNAVSTNIQKPLVITNVQQNAVASDWNEELSMEGQIVQPLFNLVQSVASGRVSNMEDLEDVDRIGNQILDPLIRCTMRELQRQNLVIVTTVAPQFDLTNAHNDPIPLKAAEKDAATQTTQLQDAAVQRKEQEKSHDASRGNDVLLRPNYETPLQPVDNGYFSVDEKQIMAAPEMRHASNIRTKKETQQRVSVAFDKNARQIIITTSENSSGSEIAEEFYEIRANTLQNERRLSQDESESMVSDPDLNGILLSDGVESTPNKMQSYTVKSTHSSLRVTEHKKVPPTDDDSMRRNITGTNDHSPTQTCNKNSSMLETICEPGCSSSIGETAFDSTPESASSKRSILKSGSSSSREPLPLIRIIASNAGDYRYFQGQVVLPASLSFKFPLTLRRNSATQHFELQTIDPESGETEISEVQPEEPQPPIVLKAKLPSDGRSLPESENIPSTRASSKPPSLYVASVDGDVPVDTVEATEMHQQNVISDNRRIKSSLKNIDSASSKRSAIIPNDLPPSTSTSMPAVKATESYRLQDTNRSSSSTAKALNRVIMSDESLNKIADHLAGRVSSGQRSLNRGSSSSSSSHSSNVSLKLQPSNKFKSTTNVNRVSSKSAGHTRARENTVTQPEKPAISTQEDMTTLLKLESSDPELQDAQRLRMSVYSTPNLLLMSDVQKQRHMAQIPVRRVTAVQQVVDLPNVKPLRRLYAGNEGYIQSRTAFSIGDNSSTSSMKCFNRDHNSSKSTKETPRQSFNS